MALVQQLIQFARNSDSQQRYDLLATAFVLPGEHGFDQFANEVQHLSDAGIERLVSTLKIHGPEFAEVLKRHIKFIRTYTTNDWGAMAKVMIELLKSCAAIMKPRQGDNRQTEAITWFILCFKRICQTTVTTCSMADKQNPRALTRGTAFAELRTLLGIANLRNDKDKPTIVLFLAGLIVKLSLQLDVQGALAHTLRQISAVVVRMQEAPQADRLRYCYWAGRWHLLEHRIGVAYPFLKQAFDICPNRLMKHKRSIFRQLLGAAIPLGVFPHPILLQAFGFHTYFLPIIKALKSADAIALELAIDSAQPREWLRRCGLHTVLKEKCWVMIWRNLVYKTYTFLEQRIPGGRVESIPLSLLSRAFRFSYDVDDGWDPLRIQSVVMSLVAQGYIVGRVEGTEALSLRPGGTKYDRFPPFASIRQTYQVQTVWGINLK